MVFAEIGKIGENFAYVFGSYTTHLYFSTTGEICIYGRLYVFR